jgi:hypothetical protein
MLAMAVCAMACGARSLYGICQWGKEHQHLVCEALGMKRMRAPDGATLHRLFVRLEVEAFEAVLGRWLSDRGLKRGQGMAVDGKTLRGIHGEELPGVHLVAAYAHHSGVVLGQRAAPGKGRELEAVKAALDSRLPTFPTYPSPSRRSGKVGNREGSCEGSCRLTARAPCAYHAHVL